MFYNNLFLGDQVKLVGCHFAVAMVINDGNVEVHCNRYGSYRNRSGARVTRVFDSPSHNCSSNYFRCTYLTHHDMDALQLKTLGTSADDDERRQPGIQRGPPP